jgi:ADP-ribose pyrophosphatase
MKAWRRIGPTVTTQIGWRTIVEKNFIAPDGNTQTYQTLQAEDSHCVAVIAITSDLKVVLAYQFRQGPEKMMYELPGGGANKDEGWQAAALRELREETGYVAKGKVSWLGDAHKDGYMNSTWHYYLALDCELHPDGQNLDEGEFVEPVLATIEELLDYAKRGLMTDVCALLPAYEQLKKLAKA